MEGFKRPRSQGQPLARESCSNSDTARRRKKHHKSRSGCGNCRLRRVKCDETRPTCIKCKDYGVVCGYDSEAFTSTGEMVMSFKGSSMMDLNETTATLRLDIMSMHSVTLDSINHALMNSPTAHALNGQAYQLDQHDLGLLNKAYERSLQTIGTNVAKYIFKEEGLRLACLHPFLMHMVLAWTTCHDRILTSSSRNTPDRASSYELFHSYHGSSQFNAKIFQPSTNSEKDAYWLTSNLIAFLSLAQTTATSAEQLFPLQDIDVGEPDCVSLGAGKYEIMQFVDLDRNDSALRQIGNMAQEVKAFLAVVNRGEGLVNLPPAMIKFLSLEVQTISTSPELEAIGLETPGSPVYNASSPYYQPAALLGTLLPLEYSETTVLKFQTFINVMANDFRQLWNNKDPQALLLTLYWQVKLIPARQWWNWRRAVLQSQALCLYLERYHSDIPHMAELLELPKRQCGLWTMEST